MEVWLSQENWLTWGRAPNAKMGIVITSAPSSQESINDEVTSIAPQKTMFDVVDEHGISSRIFYPAKWAYISN